MLIAIDYDYTFTANPEFWRAVVALGRGHGIDWICVTRRTSPPDFEREPKLPDGILVVCAGDEHKAIAAERIGAKPDIWIDDMPGTIEPERILRWD